MKLTRNTSSPLLILQINKCVKIKERTTNRKGEFTVERCNCSRASCDPLQHCITSQKENHTVHEMQSKDRFVVLTSH